MTLKELNGLLNSTGIPFAYHHWERPCALPFGVYFTPYSVNLHADGVVYHRVEHCQVELYTKRKDPAAERKVENILDTAGFFYERSESYLDDERMFQILYEIEV